MAQNEEANLSAQQELQQSLIYLEYIKEQITVLKEQSEVLELAQNEHNQAIETLKDFKNISKKNEVLIPIGADSLVFAKIEDPSKVIINVGAGIAIEEKIGDAIKKITDLAAEKKAEEMGLDVLSIGYVNGEYDIAVVLLADDIRYVKRFTDTLVTIFPNILSKIEILDYIFLLRDGGITNPEIEKIREFF